MMPIDRPYVWIFPAATIGTGLAALSSSLSSFMRLGHLLLQGLPAWCCATSPAVLVIPGAAVAAGHFTLNFLDPLANPDFI